MSKDADKPVDAFAELIGRPRRNGRYTLMYDPADLPKWRAAETAVQVAENAAGRHDPDGQAARDLDAARLDLESLRERIGVVVFEFTAITRREYDDLVSECPPTTEQLKDFKKSGAAGALVLDPDKFAGELIERCVTKVTMPSGATLDRLTAEQYAALSDAAYSEVELVGLFESVIEVHKTSASMVTAGKG